MPTRVLSLRSRVAILVAIPLAIMVVFAGVATVHRFSAVGEANARRDDAQALLDASALVQVLQAERGRTMQAFAGVAADSTEARTQARAATDAALPAFNAAVDGIDGERVLPYASARAALEQLAALRTGIDAGSIEPFEALDSYSVLIDGLLVANGTVVQELGLSGHMAHDAAALDAVGRIAETVAVERDLLTPALTRSGAAGDERERELTVTARRDELARLFRQLLAADEDVVALQAAVDAKTTALITSTRTAVAAGAFSGDPVAWYDDMTALRDGVAEVHAEIGHHLMGDLGDLASSAGTQRTLYLLLALASVAAMGLAFAVVDMLIRRPLHHLVAEINDVARVRLPEAVAAAIDPQAEPYELYRITGGGTPELEQLAGAFNEAQLQVVGLASDQATIRRNIGEIFANLGRRNQKLIARQLSFIDRLEKREQDPEILENLFRLDHLATRMRRNAESLLVLAGTETPRTWSAPVNVGDAVRAAVAEVEQYERAEIRSMASAKLRGNIASNVSHLLAELIENGLNFSPPDSVVVISGRLRTDAYVISVIDSGIGIEPDERAVLNERLATAGAADIAPSRYLGLFVVSRLAARYGIDVELLEGESGGTHARVTLPIDLLAAEGRADAAAPEAVPAAEADDVPSANGASRTATKASPPAARERNGAADAATGAPRPERAKAGPAPAASVPEPSAPPAVAPSDAAPSERGNAPKRGEAAGTVSPVSRSSIGGTPKHDEAQTGAAPSGDAGVDESSTQADDPAGGSKLRTRPKRDKQQGQTGNGPNPARRGEVAPKAAPQPKNQPTTDRGGRSHDQTEEPEVMSSGLRRRAPRKALEDGQPDPADGGEREDKPATATPKRSAADVQSMLSSFRAAQSRAVQRTNTTDTNDDEVTA